MNSYDIKVNFPDLPEEHQSHTFHRVRARRFSSAIAYVLHRLFCATEKVNPRHPDRIVVDIKKVGEVD